MQANTIQRFEEYKIAYQQSIDNPEEFWTQEAKLYEWKEQWNQVLEWNFVEPSIEWFKGGKTNITYNCLDRHLANGGDKTAFIWEPNEPGDSVKTYTYRELHRAVCQAANTLKKLGVQKGDRVCIYMPMIPELAISTLACARIGAIHSVVFAGFSAQSLVDRIQDCTCSFVITSDGAFRGNKEIAIKPIVDEALQQCACVRTTLVVKRTNTPVVMQENRDHWWHALVPNADTDCEPEWVESEDPLFILYTSGSTGKPKGVVHTTGGYMVYAGYTFKNVFQCAPKDIYFCTADIGWITGHSYIVYGPLLNHATILLFEGVPTYPTPSRFWQIIDKHLVNIFYTAPTAIRALEAEGLDYVKPYKLDSLRVLGSVGEPINEEAWNWYHQHIGKSRCPIVDTWWQTETGGILISPLAGITPEKPSFATLPLPGIQPIIVDENGNELHGNEVSGNLCIKFPWPCIIRTTWGDHERCKQNYFSTYPGLYFTGDGCRRDSDGYYRITGRVDDVINVSGHRLGTAEIEAAINECPSVVESAVVGYPHDIKGQGIYAYVICHQQVEHDTLIHDIQQIVSKTIGPIAKPDKIQIVSGLPKTRSGKIMRRILRKIAEGDINNLGDTSTLLDPTVVEAIKKERL